MSALLHWNGTMPQSTTPASLPWNGATNQPWLSHSHSPPDGASSNNNNNNNTTCDNSSSSSFSSSSCFSFSSSSDPTMSTTNATSVQPPAGCFVLRFQDFIPWDNSDNLVSFQAEGLVRQLKDVVFLPVLFLIGGPANVINMAVFYRQGLRERINVCLFALSLADELFLAFNMMWYGEQLYLQFTTKEMSVKR